jgi:hypothetical protein
MKYVVIKKREKETSALVKHEKRSTALLCVSGSVKEIERRQRGN